MSRDPEFDRSGIIHPHGEDKGILMGASSVKSQPVTSIPHHDRRFTALYFKPKLRDRALQLAYSIPLGHIAIFTAVAVYYLATQKVGWITFHWNHLLGYSWWPDVRHQIRNGIIEGELAAGAAIIAFANPRRRPGTSKLSKFSGWLMGYTSKPDIIDKFMCLLHIPNQWQTEKRGGPFKPTTPLQYIFAIPSVLLVGLPGNLVGFAWFDGIKPGVLALLHDIHVHLVGWSVTAAAGTGAGATEANLARAGFDAKVIGVLGTFFFARRVFLKVGLDYQDFLSGEYANHIVSLKSSGLGRVRSWLARPRWPLPATFRAQVWFEVQEAESTATGTKVREVAVPHGHLMRWVVLAVLPAIGWLAWYGHGVLAAHGGV